MNGRMFSSVGYDYKAGGIFGAVEITAEQQLAFGQIGLGEKRHMPGSTIRKSGPLARLSAPSIDHTQLKYGSS